MPSGSQSVVSQKGTQHLPATLPPPPEATVLTRSRILKNYTYFLFCLEVCKYTSYESKLMGYWAVNCLGLCHKLGPPVGRKKLVGFVTTT
jgi:hypothetical protein